MPSWPSCAVLCRLRVLSGALALREQLAGVTAGRCDPESGGPYVGHGVVPGDVRPAVRGAGALHLQLRRDSEAQGLRQRLLPGVGVCVEQAGQQRPPARVDDLRRPAGHAVREGGDPPAVDDDRVLLAGPLSVEDACVGDDGGVGDGCGAGGGAGCHGWLPSGVPMPDRLHATKQLCACVHAYRCLMAHAV
jgi:hypothetical protein